MEDALTSAGALELLHNAFLIHDDIQDVSEFRRGVSPACTSELGVPLAINAGDAMLALRFACCGAMSMTWAPTPPGASSTSSTT